MDVKNLTEEQVFNLDKSKDELETMSIQERHAYLMPKEARGEAPPVTRSGKIVEVLSLENERLYIIEFMGLYVYMFQKDAPVNLLNLVRSQLIGMPIRFKPVAIEDDKIIVSNAAIKAYYEHAKDSGKILHGRVLEYHYYKNDPIKFYLTIKSKGDRIIIPFSEVTRPFPRDLSKLKNKLVNFVIINIQNGHFYGSMQIVHQFYEYHLLELLKNGETVRPVVEALPSYGALLSYKNDIELRMRNKDFATDYTRCEDVLNVGDRVRVKLSEISPHGQIVFVEPYEKYTAPAIVDLSAFEEGQEYDGQVVGVSSFGCFVRVAPGRDILCPISFDQNEPRINDQVRVLIKKNDPDNHKFRGKIVGYKNDVLDLSEFDLL